MRASERRRKYVKKAWYKSLMAEKSCELCGEDHPGVLDWHHLDPSTKKTTIPTLISQNVSMNVVLAEMAKCIVVCANCHRKIHWEEAQKSSTDNRT